MYYQSGIIVPIIDLSSGQRVFKNTKHFIVVDNSLPSRCQCLGNGSCSLFTRTICYPCSLKQGQWKNLVRVSGLHIQKHLDFHKDDDVD